MFRSRQIIVFILLMVANRIHSQKLQYKYDKANRLIQVTYPNQISVIYTYDNDGNRVQSNIASSTACPNGQASFYACISDPAKTYQWQVNTGTGFVNISNNSNYSGATSHTLLLNNAPTSWYGYIYRCMINTGGVITYSTDNTLKFTATWVGGTSTAWENPANWSCSGVPDANTDVIVNGGSTYLPLVNSIASCRSLSLKNNASCTVNAGQKLTLTGQ
jgi:YD repeat-containing protein